MKTFKLVNLSFLQDDSKRPIPLIDGLIINKEFGGDNWLIETYIPKDHLPRFEELANSEELVPIQAVISKPDNDPATFHAKVKHISVMDEHISVLMDASLFRRNNSFHVDLLAKLVEEGLSGDDLLQQFTTRSKGDHAVPQASK